MSKETKDSFAKINKFYPTYHIGIDTSEDDSLSYCLSMRIGDDIYILLAKTMDDNKAFFDEVTNLTTYFNATTLINEQKNK